MQESAQDSEADRLRVAVAECIQRLPGEGPAAVDSVCRAHPDLADRIRERLNALREIGLLDTTSAEPHVPERLGDFHLLERLGGGGMGIVYRARQLSLGRTVALKLVRPDQLYFPGTRERFRREVESVARLQHPGIVPIFCVGEESGVPYFAMEEVAGCTLAEALVHLRGRPAALQGRDLAGAIHRATSGAGEADPSAAVFQGAWWETCVRVARQMADALHHAHLRGVFHRDLKPSNVMLTSAGRVLLVDFGLSSSEGSSRLTRTGAIVGSLLYLSPELLGEGGEADSRSDVYSLGVTLYEMLALRHPFDGADGADGAEQLRRRILEGNPPRLRHLHGGLPWDVETVCMTAMDLAPRQRYATAADLVRDLDNLLQRRPIEARRPGVVLRSRRLVQRHPTAATAAFLLFVGPLAFALRERQIAGELRQQKAQLAAANLQLETEKVEAERARQAAIDNLRRALDACDRFLRQAGYEQLADVPHLEPLRRGLLEEAVQFHQELLNSGQDAIARRPAAQAFSQLGSVQQLLGQVDAAVESFQRSEELWTAARAEAPEDPTLGEQLGIVRLNRGNVERMLGRAPEALRSYEFACEVLRASLDAHEDPRVRLNLAIALDNAGNLHDESGSDEAAIAAYLQAAAVLEPQRATRQPDTLLELARSDHGLAGCLLRTGRPAEAEEAILRARALRRALLAGDPENATLRRETAGTEAKFGRVLLARGDAEAAAEVLEAAVVAVEDLVRDYHSAPEYRWDLGQWRCDLGIALQACGLPLDAERAFEAALEVQSALASEHPEVPHYASECSGTLGSLALLLAAEGDPEQALERVEHALELQERALRSYPAHREFQRRWNEQSQLRAELRALLPEDPPSGTGLRDG